MPKEKSEVFKSLADSINKVWNAGLGALAQAEKQGDELVQTLVKHGKKYEDLVPAAEEAVKDSLGVAKEQAARGIADIEAAIDRQIQKAIARAGLAKQTEIDGLKKEIASLKRRQRAANPAKKKTRPAPSASKPSAANKAKTKK